MIKRLLPCVAALLLGTAATPAHPAVHTIKPPVPRRACGPDVLDRGIASSYAWSLHGNATASGEMLDMTELTAAHPTVPFGRTLEVTDRTTGKRVYVRVNDRGPFVAGRVVDLTDAALRKLGHTRQGLFRVSVKLCR